MRTSMSAGVFLATVIVSCLAVPGPSLAASQDYVKAADTALVYTVSLTVEGRHGSGFIVKEGRDYYVITHLSIVRKVEKITVETADGKEYEAELRGSSPGEGLAVFRLIGVKGAPSAAKFGRSDKLEIGEKVLAVGRPQGYGICVTAGIVSGIRRGDTGDGKNLHYIMTDAAINVGHVGAPLVNLDGEVVGMCVVFSGKRGPRSAASRGLNFAIPIDVVQDAVRQVIRLGGALATLRDFGFRGLQDLTRITMEKYRLRSKEGVLVRSVQKDGPAAQAGITAGAVILEFDGKTVKDAAHLKALVESTKVGSKVTVKYVSMRDGKPVIDKATIELPEPADGDIGHDRPAEEPGALQSGPPPTTIPDSVPEAVPVVSSSGDAAEYVNPVIRAASRVVGIGGGGSSVVLFKDIGSGSADTRYLVSAAHIIGKRKTVKVIFHKKKGDDIETVPVNGEVVGTDVKSDIAVIKVVVRGAPDPIACADMSRVCYGTEVLAVGSGSGGSPVVTAGVVSMKEQRPRDGFIRGFYTTTARVVRANDGGALIDTSGRLVGICTGLGGYYEKCGMSFVIPADVVCDIARQIIVNGKAKSGFLGLDAVRNLEKDEKVKYKTKHGVMVLDVVKSSPADKAGLKGGQVIVRFDGDRVGNVEHLKMLVAAAQIGKKTQVVIIDTDGQRKTLEVKIAEKE